MAAPAASRPARRRRTVLAGLLCAVLAAAGLVAYLVTRSTPRDRAGAAAAPAPASSSAPGPATTPAASTTVRRAPAPAVEHVPAAVPTRFTLTGRLFTIRARVCPMANVRPYDPPGEQRHTVCWVRNGFGVRPGSDTATSYVFGHSWAEDPLEVLNRASAPVTREVLRARPVKLDGVTVYPAHVLDGYRLVLRTGTGTLTYTVRRVYGVRKSQLGFIRSWEDPTVRNRVVLTTCAELGGVDYDYNIVIEAYLHSAKRLTARR